MFSIDLFFFCFLCLLHRFVASLSVADGAASRVAVGTRGKADLARAFFGAFSLFGAIAALLMPFDGRLAIVGINNLLDDDDDDSDEADADDVNLADALFVVEAATDAAANGPALRDKLRTTGSTTSTSSASVDADMSDIIDMLLSLIESLNGSPLSMHTPSSSDCA